MYNNVIADRYIPIEFDMKKPELIFRPGNDQFHRFTHPLASLIDNPEKGLNLQRKADETIVKITTVFSISALRFFYDSWRTFSESIRCSTAFNPVLPRRFSCTRPKNKSWKK
jgi:hypothetical protein